jgi:hypothetical protein
MHGATIKIKLPVIYHNTQQIHSHNYHYFAFYVKLTSIRIGHFFNVCHHTNVQGPLVDGAKIFSDIDALLGPSCDCLSIGSYSHKKILLKWANRNSYRNWILKWHLEAELITLLTSLWILNFKQANTMLCSGKINSVVLWPAEETWHLKGHILKAK